MKILKLTIIVGIGLVLLVVAGSDSQNRLNRVMAAPDTLAQASCNRGPTNRPTSNTTDLDHSAADWGIYCEGSPTGIKRNVRNPSIDRRALQSSITGGAPYSNVHCYRNLQPQPSAVVFNLSLSFWFTLTTCNNLGGDSIVQALEFTMNKWHQGKRYEFALQLENVAQNAGSNAPQWRFWDASKLEVERWVPLGIPDCLEAGKWHTLELKGEIANGQVYYTEFTIDNRTHPLHIVVPPANVPGEADRLAVAVQLDGNSKQSPYDLFIDKVNFIWDTIRTDCRDLEKGAVIAGSAATDWQSDCAYRAVFRGGETIKLTTWGVLLKYCDSTIRSAQIIPPGVTVNAPPNSVLFAGYRSRNGAEAAYRNSNPTAVAPISHTSPAGQC